MPFAMKSAVSRVRNTGVEWLNSLAIKDAPALVLLPGRLAAHFAKLPKGSDHEQIFSMFANTAFWSLAGVLFVVLAV